MELTAKELLEIAFDEQMESSYGVRIAVIGYEDVKAGYRPLYPVTVYLLAEDDTSGIVGILFPSGEFIPTIEPRKVTAYWEFDETLKYVAIPGAVTPEGTPRVVGDSWTYGEVLWDGCASEIEPHVDMVTEVEVRSSQKGSGTLFVKAVTKAKVAPHVRQQPDINAITGEWATYGEGKRDERRTGALHLGHLGNARSDGSAFADAA